MSTVGGYLEYRGGVILSNVGGYLEHRGGYHDAHGRYHEYCGGVQYRWGKIFCYLLFEYPHGTHEYLPTR